MKIEISDTGLWFRSQYHQSLNHHAIIQNSLIFFLIHWIPQSKYYILIITIVALTIGRINIFPPFVYLNRNVYFRYPQQPIILLLPNSAPNAETDDRYTKLNEEENQNKLKSNTGHIDEKKDAVILDADYNSEEVDPKKAMMVMPNDPRLGIGSIISLIPFLPIEINVPDTINWISSLIPGWFSRPAQKPEIAMRPSSKGPMPILVLPAPMMPQVYK